MKPAQNIKHLLGCRFMAALFVALRSARTVLGGLHLEESFIVIKLQNTYTNEEKYSVMFKVCFKLLFLLTAP
jgi:hypothetical protein